MIRDGLDVIRTYNEQDPLFPLKNSFDLEWRYTATPFCLFPVFWEVPKDCLRKTGLYPKTNKPAIKLSCKMDLDTEAEAVYDQFPMPVPSAILMPNSIQ